MGESPKTLSDVKALLEEAVQVVNDLETAATAPSETPAENTSPSDQASDGEEAEAPAQRASEPTPPTV